MSHSVISSSVDTRLVPKWWIENIPHIERALVRSGSSHDIEALWDVLCKGQAQFWATPTCFVVTQIIEHPLKRVARFWLAGGEDLQDLIDTFHDRILTWAREMNCDEIEFEGRLGWHRVLPEGWQRRSEICVLSLRGAT